MEKPSNVCFGSNVFTQTIAICSAVLTHDDLGAACVGVFDIDRELQFFLIAPHRSISSPFRFFGFFALGPRPRHIDPAPFGKRSVGILRHGAVSRLQFFSGGILQSDKFIKIIQCRAASGMGIEIQSCFIGGKGILLPFAQKIGAGGFIAHNLHLRRIRDPEDTIRGTPFPFPVLRPVHTKHRIRLSETGYTPTQAFAVLSQSIDSRFHTLPFSFYCFLSVISSARAHRHSMTALFSLPLSADIGSTML